MIIDIMIPIDHMDVASVSARGEPKRKLEIAVRTGDRALPRVGGRRGVFLAARTRDCAANAECNRLIVRQAGYSFETQFQAPGREER